MRSADQSQFGCWAVSVAVAVAVGRQGRVRQEPLPTAAKGNATGARRASRHHGRSTSAVDTASHVTPINIFRALGPTASFTKPHFHIYHPSGKF
jgi:hypothetical protein